MSFEVEAVTVHKTFYKLDHWCKRTNQLFHTKVSARAVESYHQLYQSWLQKMTEDIYGYMCNSFEKFSQSPYPKSMTDVVEYVQLVEGEVTSVSGNMNFLFKDKALKLKIAFWDCDECLPLITEEERRGDDWHGAKFDETIRVCLEYLSENYGIYEIEFLNSFAK